MSQNYRTHTLLTLAAIPLSPLILLRCESISKLLRGFLHFQDIIVSFYIFSVVHLSASYISPFYTHCMCAVVKCKHATWLWSTRISVLRYQLKMPKSQESSITTWWKSRDNQSSFTFMIYDINSYILGLCAKNLDSKS